MDPKTNGNEPAAPRLGVSGYGDSFPLPSPTGEWVWVDSRGGLTKREAIAKDVLATLAPAAINGYPCNRKERYEQCAQNAIDLVDALLRALAAGGEG